MRNFFIFDGKNSLDFGIRVENFPNTPFPERVYETYQVPGRSGSLVYDTGAYGNVTQSYDCWYKPIGVTSYEFQQYLARWLLAPKGYRVLRDSCFPDHFRRAMYAGPADISSFFGRYGRISLDFQCMPQKWLISGQYPINAESGMTLYNDGETALPLIQVEGTGAGTLGIGSSIIEFSEIPAEGLTIDAEVQNIYSGLQNKNNVAKISGGFPTLPHGASGISFSGGITGVSITPRWWIL